VPDKLPEEFAPTGPQLSKFPIRPAPPVKPHLFADEARFALRLSLLAGGTEFAAWVWLAAARDRREVLVLAALRLLKPLWARLGTRIERTAVAFVLLAVALFVISASMLSPVALMGAAVVGAGLPAVADLCASCIGDTVTVERRAAAYAWLDMGQALGGAVGLALGSAYGGSAILFAIPALGVAAVGISPLRDRGTPRSSWPLRSYAEALRTPLAMQLCVAALACGLLAGPGSALFGFAAPLGRRWVAVLLPLLGMALAARVEPRMPNALWLPRASVLIAAAGLLLPTLRPLALGMMFAAIPAGVARGAGEMERPLVSSLAWSAFIAGAAIGAVL